MSSPSFAGAGEAEALGEEALERLEEDAWGEDALGEDALEDLEEEAGTDKAGAGKAGAEEKEGLDAVLSDALRAASNSMSISCASTCMVS